MATMIMPVINITLIIIVIIIITATTSATINYWAVITLVIPNIVSTRFARILESNDKVAEGINSLRLGSAP